MAERGPLRGFWAGSEDWPEPRADPEDEIRLLTESGLIDCSGYAAANGLGAPDEAVRHFVQQGWREGRQPNAYFATTWYLQENQAVQRGGGNPLLHYMLEGEAAGRAPAPWFDLQWYATQHRAAPGQTLLAHFLALRRSGTVSPLPEFDAAFYLSRYPDVAAAGVDPFEHYLLWGYREGRDPSAQFDTRFYLRRHLGGELGENPLLHYRRSRGLMRLTIRAEEEVSGVYAQTRRFTRPGPTFEEVVKLPPGVRRKARALAFYLPQFHPIAENDAWWGKGFTEWTSIARAQPRFDGHYQPRIPRDLGHYTLTDPGVMRRQAALARDAGVAGFVHYFYWFNGRRLLERPTETMLEDASIDMPFCLMWANENWTRRWDGSEHEVLIAQDWREADEPALIACLLRHMRDARYIRVDGRPLLMVYRPALIPDTRATVARWRAAFAAEGEMPILVMAQSFEALDPRAFGFDAAVEFPPHKLVTGLPQIGAELQWFDAAAGAQVYDYADVVGASLSEAAPDFPLIKTAVPGWDNDARRQGNGLALHGATPGAYQAWLAALVARAQQHTVFGEAIVCINAWNEWAEGAYLEPDAHFGAAFLNATGRAVCGLGAAEAPRLLLVGHDAFPAGAQMLLLHLARQLRARHGVNLVILLLGDGALRAEYEAVAPVTVTRDVAAFLTGHRFDAAIVNSAASAAAVTALEGVRSVLLLHEMPRFIAANGLAGVLPAACAAATEVFVPAASVRDALAPLVGREAAVLPQGCYRPAPFDAAARAELRARLGLPAQAKLVLGAGYGDMRKGFDLFLQAWRFARKRDRYAVFCWIGGLDPGLESYLAPEIEAAQASGSFLLPGRQDDPGPWYAAADVFALTSREDPFPSVVLEALSAGLPSVVFAGSGGMVELVRELEAGAVVPMADASAFARAALELAVEDTARRQRLAGLAVRQFDFAAYAARLLQAAMPQLPRISVVVPSYNYARYLPARLGSIFAQTHPVSEVILLDDASTDDSVAVARRVAAEWGRQIQVVVNRRNSGGVFRQWQRGVQRARGEFVWIAEADDEADPAFLATLAGQLRAAPDADLLACDSRAVDAEGARLWADHQGYFAASDAAELGRDAVFPAREFARRFLSERNLLLNASAVLWRRAPLVAALRRVGGEVEGLRVAGDWRLYLEVLGHSAGTVAWSAAVLNAHRRHAGSVTGGLAADRHLAEVRQVQSAARAVLPADAPMRARQEAYLRVLARDLGVTRASRLAAD